MSLLSTISNFAKNILGIGETPVTTANSATNNSNSIIEVSNIEKPVDTVEITQKKENNTVQKQSLGSLKNLIENK